ncbi:uncharacterized protein LOC134542111 [Bacillus rossius redtenbacheri]|uniref:uncharacterized protein LOC134542111 n=1 Tax=Bacillus rossius redtenbacheri TaxID=93214 RepID=UPI002FDD48BC
MPRKYVKRLGSRPYRNYSEQQLQKALRDVAEKKLSLQKASEMYRIPLNTNVFRLKMTKSSPDGAQTPTRCSGGQTVFSMEEEESIAAHIIGMSTFGFPVTTTDLKVIVKSYLTKMGRKVKIFEINNNTPGNDWILGFLKRHPDISARMAKNITLSRARVDQETISQFFVHLKKELEGVPPTNIYNYDETNVVDDPGNVKVLVKRGTKYPERIRNATKACTTLMLCGNAAGQLIPVYVVYKAEHIYSTWQEGGPPGTRYNRSKSGWMDSTLFHDWFEFLLLPHLKKQPGKKLILGDNLSSHFNVDVLRLCEQHHISFVALPPNSTHLLQPLDVAFFRPMKVKWREILNEWKTTPYGRCCGTIPKQDFPGLLSTLMKSISERAETNLKSGFRKCGIFPLKPEEVLNRLCDSAMDKLPNYTEKLQESFMDFLKKNREETVGAK